jgi:hypothetical protein
MSVIDVGPERAGHPVDLVEQVAAIRDWTFDRPGEDEISIAVAGRGSDYSISFTWMDDLESLHLSCSFDVKIPARRRADLVALLALVNEQLWIGHFDIWSKEGIVMYRHSLFLAGGAEVNPRQCEALIEIALDTCERYFQAFQFVIWAGKTPREALDAVLFETKGEA